MTRKRKHEKNKDFETATSVVKYLRMRHGLSQQALCKCCSAGLHPNDISKLEHFNYSIQIGKAQAVASFFGVSLETIVSNCFSDLALLCFPDQAERQARMKAFRLKRHSEKDDIGKCGEQLVLASERERLKESGWGRLVDASYAESDLSGFDILSFDKGMPLFIEVKASIGNEDLFFLTENERLFAEYCLTHGQQYKLVRITNVMGEKKRGMTVYSAEELLGLERKVVTYAVKEEV